MTEQRVRPTDVVDAFLETFAAMSSDPGEA
jgi:hypothetical protein